MLRTQSTEYMRGAPKVMVPISLCWPTTSEVDFGCMAVQSEPFCQYQLNFVFT